MVQLPVSTDRARGVARHGERCVSKKRAIGVLYFCFGAVLVGSAFPDQPVGIAIGAPFLVLGAWTLQPPRRRQ